MKRIAVAIVVVAVVGAWLLRPHHKPRAYAPPSRKLDVPAFRAELAARIQRAKQVAARHPDPSAWAIRGVPFEYWRARVREVLHPCLLGPTAVCDSIAPSVYDCDRGDAQACIAVGQYVEDTPPRARVAVEFFEAACRLGDAAGCERYYALQTASDETCESDPYGCAYRPGHDLARMNDACALGVGFACTWLAAQARDAQDLASARGYLEAACQLGEGDACVWLGDRLDPGCEDDEDSMPYCFDADERQAHDAYAIACAAGFESACGKVNP